jgi:putative transferase (TIGR04331 family)
MHFIENVRKSDLFNWQLYSQIVDFLNVKTLQLDAKSSDFRALKNKNKLIVNLKDVRHKIISSLINRGFSSDAAFYVTLFDQASSLKLTALTGFKAWPITNIDFPWKPGSEPNVEIRGSLAQLQGPDEFTNLIFRTLSQNLPTAFLEDFPAVDAFVQKRMQKKTPKAIFTGIGFLWNPVFALWAAECADKGAKIFGVQHGGTYGEVDYSYGESVERDIADKYISWGWQDGSDVEPLPSPHLVKVKAAGVPPEDRVLVVSTLDSRYAYFLSPLPFSTRFIRHFENQESFLENIDPLILKRIVFRLYPDDFGWKVRERLSNRFPDLQFDDRGLTFRESVERSKLVVFDHFGGTTFLEALSLTVPVMTFSDPELFSIRPMARKYYDALNGCGVLHYSPVEAAETLNKHFNRLDEWWENQERQQAVDDFRTRFAWQESNAIRRWAHFVRDHTGRDAI